MCHYTVMLYTAANENIHQLGIKWLAIVKIQINDKWKTNGISSTQWEEMSSLCAIGAISTQNYEWQSLTMNNERQTNAMPEGSSLQVKYKG